jgi:hypothetical protein
MNNQDDNIDINYEFTPYEDLKKILPGIFQKEKFKNI